MYTKNSHRRYTALACKFTKRAGRAHVSTAVGPCAAPRATPIWSALFLPSQPPMQHPLSLPAPCPLQAPTSSLSARILSHQTRPHTSCPQYVPERKSHTRLHRSHEFAHSPLSRERERPSLFFSELVPGAALRAAKNFRRVCSTTMAIPRAGWVALPPLCNGQLLL